MLFRSRAHGQRRGGDAGGSTAAREGGRDAGEGQKGGKLTLGCVRWLGTAGGDLSGRNPARMLMAGGGRGWGVVDAGVGSRRPRPDSSRRREEEGAANLAAPFDLCGEARVDGVELDNGGGNG